MHAHTPAPNRRIALTVACLAGCVAIAKLARAGGLNPPPGPVAPTMKTLDQVEPRTPLGPADVPITISIGGSYYLTGDIFSVNAPSFMIRITASDVTLDLNGFSVDGASDIGVTPIGILVERFAENVEIRGGTVRECTSHGVDATGASHLRLVDVRLRNNGGDGARIGLKGAAVRCAAQNNGASGFFVDEGSAVVECVASGNVGSGVNTFVGGAVITGCSLSANGADGVSAVASVISNCSANVNGRDGVRVSGDCAVLGNNCHGNGVSIEGAGIRVVNNADNRIEGNNCTGNDLGIRVGSGGNFIARNTCSGNTTNNWDVVSGNACLVVAATTSGVILGDSGGVSPGSTNPNANFTY